MDCRKDCPRRPCNSGRMPRFLRRALAKFCSTSSTPGQASFLAAAAETPPLATDAKRKLVESLSARLIHGENFSDLVAASSEDEATKKRGGDLGYFSALRMPADFFAATTKLHMGQFSPADPHASRLPYCATHRFQTGATIAVRSSSRGDRHCNGK